MKAGIGNTICNLRIGEGETKFTFEVLIDDSDVTGNRDFEFAQFTPITEPSVVGEVDCIIDWGDGNSESVVGVNKVLHTYSQNGTYEISIEGRFGVCFRYGDTSHSGTDNASKVRNIKSWGNKCSIISLEEAFAFCYNSIYSATDYPNISNLSVSSFRYIFLYFNRFGSTIISLDLSNWTDIGNVTDLRGAFRNVINCSSINIDNWDTSNVTIAAGSIGNAMFSYINRTSSIPPPDQLFCNISAKNLNFSSCSDFEDMFQYSFISDLDLSNWTFSNTTPPDFYRMFYIIPQNLPTSYPTVSLDLSGWTNAIPSNVRQMFRSFKNLKSVNISGIDFSNISDFEYLFNGCEELNEIIGLNSLDNTNGTAFEGSFRNLYKFSGFTSANFSQSFKQNFVNVTTMEAMFEGNGLNTTGVTPPNIEDLDVSNVTNFNSTFAFCKYTSNIDFSLWDLSKADEIGDFMRETTGLTNVDLSNSALFSASSSPTNYIANFAQNSEVETIAFGNTCDFSKVTDLGGLAQNAPITEITWPTNVDFSSLLGAANMLTTGVGSMSTSSYDNFLIRLDTTGQKGGTYNLDAGDSTYTGGGAAATARANLVAGGWNINDGGIA